MFCRKRRIRKRTFPPVAPDWSESALMTLHPRHVYKDDVFIDHTHWLSENEYIVHVMRGQRHVRHSLYYGAVFDALHANTAAKIILFIVGHNKCACKNRKKSTLAV